MEALSSVSPTISTSQPGRGRALSFTAERCVAAVLVVALIAWKIFAALHYRVDSDEPQHLHVVWGWANGFLQYRDLFDNHSPLFQMLCAPLFRALGERADILVPMRLAMIPLFFLSLWCIYKIGARLWNPLGGWIAAALTAVAPTFFYSTTEFRTDDLWGALWMVALLIFASGEFNSKRAFWFGLTLGAAFATSMKTSLLAGSLAIAALAVLGFRRIAGERFDLAKILTPLVLAIAGALIIPTVLVAFFAAKGALPQMIYCVIQHNALPGLGKLGKLGFHEFIFPLVLPLLLLPGWLYFCSHNDRRIGAQRATIMMAAGIYMAFLRSYWPLVTVQDWIPFLPMFFLAGTPLILAIGNWCARFHPALRFALPTLLVALEICFCYRVSPFSKDDLTPNTRHLAELLKLTDPGQYVMDAKGDSIFRPRPFYLVLEGVTIARMHRGLIADDLPQALIKTSTCVVSPRRLSEVDYAFIDNNYIRIAEHLLVAGKSLGDIKAGETVTFQTLWPARYKITCQDGTLKGTLDGEPLHGAFTLPPGTHALQLSNGAKQVALVWAQALERGFTPFSGKHK